jgi:hypothetical protein
MCPLPNAEPGGMAISPGRRVFRPLTRCHRPWPGCQAPTNPPSRRARPSRSRIAVPPYSHGRSGSPGTVWVRPATQAATAAALATPGGPGRPVMSRPAGSGQPGRQPAPGWFAGGQGPAMPTIRQTRRRPAQGSCSRIDGAERHRHQHGHSHQVACQLRANATAIASAIRMNACHGAAAPAAAGSEVASWSVSSRAIGRSSAEW